MSKYRPLSDRLARETADDWRPTFAELEEVLGFPLPKAAQQGAWWSGGEKPHHRTWTTQGWEVGGVDRTAGVHFRRAPIGLNAGSLEPTTPDPVQPAVMKEASDIASRRAKVQRAVGGAAIFGGALAVLAGVGVLSAKLLGKRRT